MVAYYFPPAAGVGTFRVTKFVKYLSGFGWQPVVLTVNDNNYASKDDSLLEDTKHAKIIYRTDVMNLPINDVGLKWAWRLFKEAKRIIKSENIDIVFYTGGPFFQWVVAPLLKKKTKIPYVLDYRDPWGFNPYEKGAKGVKNKLGTLITKFFEPRVLRGAIKVIFATEEMQNEYKRYFSKEATKFVVIENGFDADDYKKVEPKRFKKFTIAYTGKFSHYRNPEKLFKAIGEFGKKVPQQFIHVGNKEPFVQELATRYLGDDAKFVGPQSYYGAISYAKGADALVLISGGSNIEFTHKVFDYISCNKPIIAVVSKNSYLGKFLANFENAFIVNDNVDEIHSALKQIYEKKLSSLGFEIKNFSKYSRKNLTSQLAEALNSIKK